MGFRDLINRVFDSGSGGGLGIDELARRLDLTEAELSGVQVSYNQFSIPKRTGGMRTILSPNRDLKALQRRILHRLLKRIPVHPAAIGFESHRSIVTNALPHVGKQIVLKMDVREFFTSTSSHRIRDFFERIGWSRKAASLLTSLCTYEGGLPQGAPTSPRLSNLVNARMDARLAASARKLGAAYTRYADDLTFSFTDDKSVECHRLIRITKLVLKDFGYELHTRKKLHIRRQHQQQIVTGLVVNKKARLPRSTRRWLRAVEHRAAIRGAGSLTEAQLQGWRSLQKMVSQQSSE